jgi:hypothetical protein
MIQFNLGLRTCLIAMVLTAIFCGSITKIFGQDIHPVTPNLQVSC